MRGRALLWLAGLAFAVGALLAGWVPQGTCIDPGGAVYG
jgi:hypothetical protein